MHQRRQQSQRSIRSLGGVEHIMNERELTELFRKLGASDPEGWASSQIEDGIPQLARFLFLRQAWKNVVREDDPSWIDNVIAHAEKRPNDPYAGAGHALRRLRER